MFSELKQPSDYAPVFLCQKVNESIIVVSSAITSWEIDGETVDTVTDFIFLGSKITADSDSHEINRLLLLGRKTMTSC